MTYLDMIDRLLGSSEYRRIANKNEINSYQPLYTQIDIEGTESSILSTYLNFGMLEYFAEFLIMLDYVAYVPFGKKGEKYVENCLKNIGKNISISKYKKKIMVKALNNHGIEVGEIFNERIDSFLRYLQTPMQNLENIESVAATVRIVSGYIDTLVAQNKVIGLRERDEEMEKIIENIWTYVKTSGSKIINLNDFLPNQENTLSDYEKKYINYITDIIPTNDKNNNDTHTL